MRRTPPARVSDPRRELREACAALELQHAFGGPALQPWQHPHAWVLAHLPRATLRRKYQCSHGWPAVQAREKLGIELANSSFHRSHPMEAFTDSSRARLGRLAGAVALALAAVFIFSILLGPGNVLHGNTDSQTAVRYAAQHGRLITLLGLLDGLINTLFASIIVLLIALSDGKALSPDSPTSRWRRQLLCSGRTRACFTRSQNWHSGAAQTPVCSRCSPSARPWTTRTRSSFLSPRPALLADRPITAPAGPGRLVEPHRRGGRSGGGHPALRRPRLRTGVGCIGLGVLDQPRRDSAGEALSISTAPRCQSRRERLRSA